MTNILEYILRLKDQTSDRLKSIAKEAEKADGKTGGLERSLGRVFSIAAAGYAFKSVIDLGQQIQKTGLAFETMLGSQEKGLKLMDQINDFANATPFDNIALSKNAQTLLQFGEAGDDVVKTLKILGDISAGDQEKMNSLTLAFGQMNSAGKLMGQDLLQMINAGFNPLKVISEQTGKSMGYLKDQMSKGAISSDMVREAFRLATAEGGQFHGMMEKMANSGTGKLSTMLGKGRLLLASLGEFLLTALIPVFDAMSRLFDWFSRNAEIIGILATTLGPVVIGLIGVVKWTAILIKVMRAWAVIQGIINALMTANPIGLLIVGIAALVAGIVIAYKKFDKFRGFLHGLMNVFKQVGQNIKNFLTNPLEGLKKMFGSILGPFFEAIAHVKNGNFMQAAKALGRGIIGAVPVVAVSKMLFSGAGDAYNKGYQEGKNKETDKGAAVGTPGAEGSTGGFGGLGGSPLSGLKSGISEIKAGAPKVFNINIEKLAGIESLNTTNLKAGMDSLENQLKQLLLGVLNDSQAMAAKS